MSSTSKTEPFKKFFNKLPGINLPGEISLETNDQIVTSDPGIFQLSRYDRLVLFFICFGISVACFAICFFLFPLLSLKPAKFSIIWSLGSIFFLISFCILQGSKKFMENLFKADRIFFTLCYLSSITLTLIFALVIKITLFVIIACFVQFIAMIWFSVSYFPLGLNGLRFTTSLATSQVEGWINS
ncbi:hypothetical protein PACTADRAFT_74783 [Pachysolen tannophilus NRRL Y-2460]|uniref:Protein transport protein SFT2 n=1 Tax=Pachysolen tannophilus NRRL Y-2460 TaxID=669874 RepID=A0A1E4TZS8_PACTA|nr:hypothetical protein PACTADRAFT_74783 [Pachysolen tannophilus NRRL Y-2460]